jgi:beta-aspartyl-dipeptidase (metallo-type)
MFKLIKNGKIFSPENIGVKDILIAGSKIALIEPSIQAEKFPFPVDTYDASNKVVLPGLIDPHVHLIGAGGSGGLNSRNKEIAVEQIIDAGVTTVVGCLGFDRTSRTLKSLLLKAKALEEFGLTTFMLTGSYSLPSLTLTGSVEEDLILMDKVIGVKLALGEVLANWPEPRDIRNLLAECLRGGHLGGKPGFMQIHLGSVGAVWKKNFEEILGETKTSLSKVVFTHVNRSKEDFKTFADYVKKGGYVDLTASYNAAERPGSLTVLECIQELEGAGTPLDHVTISSDSNATRILPDKRLKYLPIQTLYEVTRDLCKSGVVSMERAVGIVTRNAANVIGCGGQKGSLEKGKDADLIILRGDFELDAVLARGRWVRQDGVTLVREAF